MMREIKFRAWCNASGLLIDGDICFGYDDFNWVVLDDERNHLLSNYGGTLEQYTGLKDKNGVEIYEGDIVIKSGYGVYKKVVKWSDDSYMLPKTGQYKDGNVSCELQFEYEVIGNIHQNPELIND